VPVTARPSGVVLRYARPPERMGNAPQAIAARPSSTRGVTVSQDLLGDDRPAGLDAFHQGETAWLAGTG